MKIIDFQFSASPIFGNFEKRGCWKSRILKLEASTGGDSPLGFLWNFLKEFNLTFRTKNRKRSHWVKTKNLEMNKSRSRKTQSVFIFEVYYLILYFSKTSKDLEKISFLETNSNQSNILLKSPKSVGFIKCQFDEPSWEISKLMVKLPLK